MYWYKKKNYKYLKCYEYTISDTITTQKHIYFSEKFVHCFPCKKGKTVKKKKKKVGVLRWGGYSFWIERFYS